MIKLEHTTVTGWDAAIRGMRNPMNSWEKSDTTYNADGERTMTIDEISKLAASGTKPDSADTTLPERALWYALRDIYQAYRQGRADTEQCAKDKAVAVRQYELDTSDWVKAKEVWQSMAQFWKDAEGPSRAYAFSQNRTPEGDAMFEAFYRVPLKAQKEKWEVEL